MAWPDPPFKPAKDPKPERLRKRLTRHTTETKENRRECDGWPELGGCSGFAMQNFDYCRECEALRRAHEGDGDVTEDGDDD